jgi:predicted  nucleic acid-binding Zn-ribbon protein
MMKVMKPTISTLAALLIIFAGSSAFAQESDYRVQQDFRAEYNEIIQGIDSAMSSDDVSQISDDIDQLEADYSGYEELLNAALYPESFQNQIADLRDRLSGTGNNITAVQDLNDRIAQLQSEMEDLRNQMTQMNEEGTALRQRIDRSASNERRLSALVTQYRQNIESRDAFVNEFLEDLLSRYQSMDAQTQSDIADASESMDDNPLALIQTVLSEYINQADQQSGLTAPDYIRMRAQHAYFGEVWDNIGERLANTYASDSPVQARQEVTDLLSTWEASINNKLWNSISTAFNQNGIELQSFSNSDDFSVALNAFVDNAIETATEQNEQADLDLYQSFSDYWNSTVKADWGEYLVNGNVLTQGEIAEVDVKIGDWARNAEPVSNLMFILFLISLAVIIGLIVLLVTKKS